jgi:CDP-glucose 4,6-dehydratase
MEWRDRRVLITGISGFVGGGLALRLHGLGAVVIGVSRNPPIRSDVAEAVDFRAADVRSASDALHAVQEARPDAVFHLAATSVLHAAADEGGAHALWQSNVAATWNVLEACRRADVAAVVVTSSDKQYGALAAAPYDDDDSTAFLNGGVYELTKAQQDQTARLYAGLYDAPAVRIARFANVYGPGDLQWSRIVPGTIRRTWSGEPARLTAGPAGAAQREYLFVEDAVDALLALGDDAFERGNAPLRRTDGKLARVAWNIGSGHPHVAAEVIATIRQVMETDFGIVGPPPLVQPAPSGVFEPGHQFTRTAKLRTLLPEWSPIVLEEGLRHTVPWYVEMLGVGAR